MSDFKKDFIKKFLISEGLKGDDLSRAMETIDESIVGTIKLKINNNSTVRLIFDTDYKKYLGDKCDCGYFYDEGDYQFKCRENDFVNYNCEMCHDKFIVFINEKVVSEFVK